MNKFLIVPHEYAGFGAIIDRKIVTTKIANDYNRIPIFINVGFPYDDPYEYTITNLGKPTNIFNYTDQEDSVVLFDTNHWINNLMHESFKKRKVYEDGKILDSFILKKEYEDIVNDTLIKIPKIKESISLHIRRGDKNDPNQEPNPYYTDIDDYVKVCVNVAEKYGLNNVYLNSDSLFAIKEAIIKLQSFGLTCFYDEEQSRYDNNSKLNKDNKISASSNSFISKQETITSIKVIYTMAKSKHIIGMNNVQFTKLSSYLLTYRSDAKFGYTWLDSKNKGKNVVYSMV